MEKGINLLTEINATGSKFRIGMNAAHLLASRYYLFMENWEKAAEHATSVFSTSRKNLALLT
ncbi:MAG: hypothetical protein V8R91_12250 [Butyricimonas faecihominis]